MEPYPYRLAWEEWQKAALPFEKETLDLVSIDWDFFYQPLKRADFPDHIAEMMPGRILIEEWFSKERSLKHWYDMKERIEVIGLDPYDYFAFTDYPNPDHFSALLQDRFSFRDIYIADSHAWGSWANLVAAAGSSNKIISFDAHHDCGYWNYYPGDTDQRSQTRARARPSCDDWIQAALVHGVSKRAEIVYPDSGGEEWELNPPTLPDQFFERVHQGYFSDWQKRGGEKTEAVLLLVRSSAYSPPFFSWDDKFLQLAHSFGDPLCLDCLCPGGVKIGSHDACRARI